MRCILAYALIFLILLNIGGYQVIFTGIQYETSKSMIQKLDADAFHPDETLLVKVPLTIPYGTDSKDFQRVSGTFEYNGLIYQLVKQKFYKDTLHVIVLKDALGSKIKKAKTDLANSMTNHPGANDTAPHSQIFKKLIKDYIGNSISMETVNNGWSQSNGLTDIFNFYTSHKIVDFNLPPELS